MPAVSWSPGAGIVNPGGVLPAGLPTVVLASDAEMAFHGTLSSLAASDPSAFASASAPVTPWPAVSIPWTWIVVAFGCAMIFLSERRHGR